jgi:hypothetical protein
LSGGPGTLSRMTDAALGALLDDTWTSAVGMPITKCSRHNIATHLPISPPPGHIPTPIEHPDLIIPTNDLTSKYGFGDGDILDEFTDQWLHSRGWMLGHADVPEEELDSPGWPYITPRALLWNAWNDLLIPQSSWAAKAHWVGGPHNPLQVDDEEIIGAPDLVLRASDLAAVADKYFIPRSSTWMHTMCTLHSNVIGYSVIDTRAACIAIANLLEVSEISAAQQRLLISYVTDPHVARSWAEAAFLVRATDDAAGAYANQVRPPAAQAPSTP